MPLNSVEFPVTEENLWFTERYLNLFDAVDLFPTDAIGSELRRGVPVIIKTDLGFEIVSDIDGTKLQLRNRSKLHGWTRFTSEHAIQPGDRIILQKIGDREFSLQVVRSSK